MVKDADMLIMPEQAKYLPLLESSLKFRLSGSIWRFLLVVYLFFRLQHGTLLLN